MKYENSTSPAQGSTYEQLTIGEYVLDRTIGRGTFGNVKLGYHVRTGIPVAVKIINKVKAIEKQQLDMNRLHREVTVLRLVSNHPNIVRLYELKDTPTDLFLFLELCSRGELFDYICKKRRLSESESRTFFQQLVSAICHCHCQSICHRDLKPENILLNDNRMLKIGDFGLSNFNGSGGFLQTYCGSPNYAAPEIVCGKPYIGPEIDIWSCGVILYAMVCGYLPFDDPHLTSLFSKIKEGNIKIPGYLTSPLQNLIRRMICVDPCVRISLRDIKRHSWFDTSLPQSMKISFEYGICPPVEATLRRRFWLARHGLPSFTDEEIEEIKEQRQKLVGPMIRGIDPSLQQPILDLLEPIHEDLDVEILQALEQMGFSSSDGSAMEIDPLLRPDVYPTPATVTYHLKRDTSTRDSMPLQTAAFLGITHLAIADTGVDLLTDRQKAIYAEEKDELIRRELRADSFLPLNKRIAPKDSKDSQNVGGKDEGAGEAAGSDGSEDQYLQHRRNIPRLRLHCQDWTLMPIAFPKEIQKKAAACTVFRTDLTDHLNDIFHLNFPRTKEHPLIKDGAARSYLSKGYEHEPGLIITTLLNILKEKEYRWSTFEYSKYSVLIPSQKQQIHDSIGSHLQAGETCDASTDHPQQHNNKLRHQFKRGRFLKSYNVQEHLINKYDGYEAIPALHNGSQDVVLMVQVLRVGTYHNINIVLMTGPVLLGLRVAHEIKVLIHRRLSQTPVMRPLTLNNTKV